MQCRSCNSTEPKSIFSFGDMPLANRLIPKANSNKEEERYHLEIMLCENCGLVQLRDIVPPQKLFDEYLYFSSNSDTMINSAANLVGSLIPTLSKNSTVIEIASNDGYLLQHYLQKNIKVLGIEPAKNIAKAAEEKGIPTLQNYFSKQLAKELVENGTQADIIHANNVMAHVPDINDFVAGIKLLLKEEGQAVIEVPYLLNLINECEFDTIYHEHVYYFSLLPLTFLFDQHNLAIHRVEELAIHGGSLRLFVKHKGQQGACNKLDELISHEKKLGVNQISYYKNFAERVHSLKTQLASLLQSLKQAGKTIAAYGASAKGSTLLNYFNIGLDTIDFIVDRSSVKQDFLMSGTRIPIYATEYLNEKKPDYTLLLTWNFATEILHQQEAYRKTGGKFIIPIPELEVV